MQFTCNRCEGISQYMVNKNAYDDGIVICTCQSCGVRHLMADNLKKVRCQRPPRALNSSSGEPVAYLSASPVRNSLPSLPPSLPPLPLHQCKLLVATPDHNSSIYRQKQSRGWGRVKLRTLCTCRARGNLVYFFTQCFFIFSSKVPRLSSLRNLAGANTAADVGFLRKYRKTRPGPCPSSSGTNGSVLRLFDVVVCPFCVVVAQMDFPAFGDNIEEYMQSTGTPEEVTKGRAPDLTPDIVEKYNVVMGKDGVLTLSPKDGGDAVDGTSSSS